MDVIAGENFRVWGGRRHEIIIFDQHGRRERDGSWYSNTDARDMLANRPLGPRDTMSPLDIDPPLPYLRNAVQVSKQHSDVEVAGVRVSSRMAMYMYLADILHYEHFRTADESSSGMLIMLADVLLDGSMFKVYVFPSDEPYISTTDAKARIIW